MKNTPLILFALWLLFQLSACTVQEEIHFNKDFSGNMKRSFDFSAMMDMAKQMNPDDTTDSKMPDFENLPKDQMQDIGIEGIRNFKIEGQDEGAFTISFEFDNLEALNQAYNQLEMDNMKDLPGMQGFDMGGSGGFTPGELPNEEDNDEVTQKKEKKPHTYFVKKGKKTIIYYPSRPAEEQDTENTMEGMEQMGEMMGKMMKIETKFTFDRKISKITNDSKQINTYKESDNLLRMEANFEALEKGKKAPEIIIKLK